MRWFLLILGILIVLFVLLCWMRLGLHVKFGPMGAVAVLTIGPCRIQLAPGRGERDRQELPKEPKKPERESEKVLKSSIRLSAADLKDAYHTLMPACKRALERTRRGIRIDPMTLSLTLGGGAEPAEAAELYGCLHAGVWTVMPVLEQMLRIPDPHIHIGLDFDTSQTRAEGEAAISIRIGTLILIGTCMGIPALQWILRSRKRHRQHGAARRAAETSSETTPAA